MSAINYRTSKFLTLGLEPYSDYNFTDAEIEEIEECQGFEQYLIDCEDYARENIKALFEKYEDYFYQYKLSIESGYYEGFYINIEDEYIYYDDCIEKRATQKEITKIKQFLIECVENGLVACFPGWCTKYLSYEDTLKEISKAIKEMRQAAKAKPTYKNYHFAIA